MVTKPPTIDNRLSAPATMAVKSMLVKNPLARLCCKTGIAELKALPFFTVVDWEALHDKRIAMPYRWVSEWVNKIIELLYIPVLALLLLFASVCVHVCRPRLADDTDVSSFEATFTREKAIDSLVDPTDKDGTYVSAV